MKGIVVCGLMLNATLSLASVQSCDVEGIHEGLRIDEQRRIIAVAGIPDRPWNRKNSVYEILSQHVQTNYRALNIRGRTPVYLEANLIEGFLRIGDLSESEGSEPSFGKFTTVHLSNCRSIR